MKQILVAALLAYRRLISPLLPPACRYVPSCSEYAIESVERKGALRGTALALWRVLRCHPLARGGYDPVHSQLGESGTRLQRPARSFSAAQGKHA
jgi:putative membrane protein insertion efficiency factor